MKIKSLIFAAVLALTSVIGATAQTNLPPLPVKGTIDIQYNSRKSPGVKGVKDVYTINVNVAGGSVFNGTISDLPQLIEGWVSKEVTQKRSLYYDINCDLVNPKNPAQTKNVGRLYGKVGIDSDGTYRYDVGSLVVDILPIGNGSQLSSKFSGTALGKPLALPTTSAWFDGNLQKVCSVSASLITGEFNRFRARRWRQQQITLQQQDFMSKHGMGEEAADNFDFDSLNYADKFDVAFFDSRVFTIPDRTEVMNYFIWRNQDCSRNSVSMVAYANFSHKELQGKSTPDKHEMLKSKGINWATDFTDGEKNGRLIVKEEFKLKPVMFPGTLQQDNAATYNASRSRWVAKGAWKFTEDKDKLLAMIPTYE